MVHVLQQLDELILVLDDCLDAQTSNKPVGLEPFLQILALELLSVVILIEVLKQLCHGTPNLRVDVRNWFGGNRSPDGRETSTGCWHS